MSYDPRSYKAYAALLTQTGTNAPVATVLQNELGGAPVFARTSAGVYTMTLTDAFTANKTDVQINAFITPWSAAAGISRTSASVATIRTGSIASGMPGDGILNNTRMEIRVYP